jgi:hypothetical protein
VGCGRGDYGGSLGRSSINWFQELHARVAAVRLLGPDQAAAHLEIRRTDWDYIVTAGWITPHTTMTTTELAIDSSTSS